MQVVLMILANSANMEQCGSKCRIPWEVAGWSVCAVSWLEKAQSDDRDATRARGAGVAWGAQR